MRTEITKMWLGISAGLLLLNSSSAGLVSAASPLLTIKLSPPNSVLQGEPIFISISGTRSIKYLKFNGEKIPIFPYLGKSRGLVGVDLNQKPGDYPILVEFANKKIATTSIQILQQEHIEKPLGIPEKLGGNSTTSETQLVASLAAENLVLASTRTYPRSLWAKAFRFPIANPIVTDGYGYMRQTGSQDITHKGTDFHAPAGTPVLAMNRGIVRLARTFRVYGKTVIIDHGQGLQTLYMHLSKISVNEGQMVQRGQVIGKSGQTGYAESPHLHLSVRIQGVSIDPMKFMELFK